MNDCILHEVASGNNSITVNLEDSFSGSNVCASITGIIDCHRNNGIKIHVNCPRNSYANHVRIYNPIVVEDIMSDQFPFDKVFSFSTEEGVFKIFRGSHMKFEAGMRFAAHISFLAVESQNLIRGTNFWRFP